MALVRITSQTIANRAGSALPRLLLPWLVVAASCAYWPTDGAQFASLRSSDIVFAGYSPKQNDPISIKAKNRSTGVWEVFARTTANLDPYTDSDGRTWYKYQRTGMPIGNAYWQAGTGRTNRMEIQTTFGDTGAALVTFGPDLAQCVNGRTSGADIARNCASPRSPVVTISAPCGGAGQDACMASPSCDAGNQADVWGTTCVHFGNQGEPCGPKDACNAGFVCSVDAVCETSTWLTASQYQRLGSTPENDGFNWTDNAQGVASDGQFWYLASTGGNSMQNRGLWKVSLNTNLSQDLYPSYQIPVPYDGGKWCHYGDVDVADGWLLVPVSAGGVGACDGSTSPPGVALVLAQDMAIGNVARFPANPPGSGQIPHGTWVAVYPGSNALYTSNGETSTLSKYAWRVSPSTGKLELTAAGTLQLLDEAGNPLNMQGVQGGAFSPSGKLYLAVDCIAGAHGVHAFNVGPKFAQRKVFLGLSCSTSTAIVGGSTGDETEGITVVDTLRWGQLHMQRIDNDGPFGGNDDMTFFHWKADPNRI